MQLHIDDEISYSNIIAINTHCYVTQINISDTIFNQKKMK